MSIKFHKTTKNIVRLVSFAIAFALVLSGFAIKYYTKSKVLERQIEATQQRSFADLVTGVNSVSSALQKAQYAQSPSLIATLTNEISQSACSARSAAAGLPFSSEEFSRTIAFLTQAGDWAASCGRVSATQKSITEDERKTMQQLALTAKNISDKFTTLESILGEENIDISSIAQLNAEEPNVAQDNFKLMEDDLSGVPKLVYDGPFSSHLDIKSAKFLEEKPEINETEAMESALKFAGLQTGQLEFTGSCDSQTIPCYLFSGHLDGGEISIEISKSGGLPLSMLNSREKGESVISKQQAALEAKKFLQQNGFYDMQENYFVDTGDYLLFNFVYTKNNITYYPDLVKIGVAPDTGKIVAFEDMGYLLNHTTRKTPAPKITAADAKKIALTDGLTFESVRECVIPSPGENDISCYEVACRDNENSHVMIYVNTQTGLEEEIQILIEDETGTLAL